MASLFGAGGRHAATFASAFGTGAATFASASGARDATFAGVFGTGAATFAGVFGVTAATFACVFGVPAASFVGVPGVLATSFDGVFGSPAALASAGGAAAFVFLQIRCRTFIAFFFFGIKTGEHYYFCHFLSGFDILAPVVGSSSIPRAVIFLGSGVNVDSGFSS